MPSIAAVVRRFGAVVLVVGLFVGASGFVLVETDDCEFGVGFTLERLGANETSEFGETRRYEELTDRQQRRFDETLADLRRSSGDSATSDVYEDGPGTLASGVVVYEGTRYEVSQFASDCSDTGTVPMLLGAAGSAVGILALLAGSVQQFVE
ncbi:hypothetical protein [Halomarina rubra]|uniref:DUF7979 domain-containing protein n=1 Tax=Halomarina rubra TaxID=2071873 RepID=A0ABD6AXJ0_9EURY|nr:hypothetical protein [Halomarina rubra]